MEDRTAHAGRRFRRRVPLASLLALGAAAVAASLLGAGRPAPAAAAEAVGLVEVEWANASEGLERDCAACHRFERVLSHPVDVRPSWAVPASLPLDRGRVTCLTCHDADAASGHAERSPTGRTFLRGAGDAAGLCVSCHADDRSTAGVHARSLARAHLGVEAGASLGGLDPESQACLSCHDGVTARDAGQERRTGDFRLGLDHPIGVLFESRRTSRGRVESPLVARHMVDRRVRLFDDMVGCGSCHSVYSSQPSGLVMSNLRSALCMSCHDE